MRSFGSHLVMLLLGLSAGVVLAVVGFAPQQALPRFDRWSRPLALPPPPSPEPPAAVVSGKSLEPAAAAPRPEKAGAPRVGTNEPPQKPDGPANLIVRIHPSPEDEGAPFTTVVARVRSFEDSDPDAIASATAIPGTSARVEIPSQLLDFFPVSARPESGPLVVRREPQAILEELASGAYRVVVALHGRRVDDREVTLKAGDERRVDLALPRLAPERRLAVRVLDERGAGIADATFSLDLSIALEGTTQGGNTAIDTVARGAGLFVLFPSEFAANWRAGRVAARCTLNVSANGFNRESVALPPAATGEIAVTLNRQITGPVTTLRVRVVPADGGHPPGFGHVSLFGPRPGAALAWSRKLDGYGEAAFDELTPGRFEGWIYSAGSECEAARVTARFDADVIAGDSIVDVRLPPLHRVTVVSPPELAAAIPSLSEPDSDHDRSIRFGDGSGETLFAFVTEGLHDVRIGPHRMRIDVRDDRRFDFVADPALEIPPPKSKNR
jgi:hypothetical protein